MDHSVYTILLSLFLVPVSSPCRDNSPLYPPVSVVLLFFLLFFLSSPLSRILWCVSLVPSVGSREVGKDQTMCMELERTKPCAWSWKGPNHVHGVGKDQTMCMGHSALNTNPKQTHPQTPSSDTTDTAPAPGQARGEGGQTIEGQEPPRIPRLGVFMRRLLALGC
jgi:hypothetical protein